MEQQERDQRHAGNAAIITGLGLIVGVYALTAYRDSVLFRRALAELAERAERRPCPGCQRRRVIRTRPVTTTEEASHDRPDRTPVA